MTADALPAAAETLLVGLLTGRRPATNGQDLRAHLARLVDADLVRQDRTGRLVVTSAGRAHVRRRILARGGAIDPFLGQHTNLVRSPVADADGRSTVLFNEGESPLAWLARRTGRDGRPLIEARQFQAGERLRADFTRAQMTPRMTANWSAPARSQGASGEAVQFADVAIAARQRLRQALDAVGPELSGLLLDVCCFLKGLEDVERQRRWPPRSAKVVLQLALDRLARHFGLDEQARGSAARGIAVWHADAAASDGPPPA